MNEMYCPILIPTLNRYEHFRRCIESLSNCVDADKTVVYISVDFPPESKYVEGYDKIKEYLCNLEFKEFKEFKEVKIFFQEKNLGAYGNVDFLIDQIKDKYDWYISTEDDNEFAIGYLRYINTAIEKFKDDPDFMGACGYQIDNSCVNQAWRKGNEMAYGSAKSIVRRRKLCDEINKMYGKVLSCRDFFRLLRNSHYCAASYVDFWRYNTHYYYNKNGTIACIDVTLKTYMILNKGYVVEPLISLVRNWGQDGSGLHSAYNEELQRIERTKKLWNGVDFDFDLNSKMLPKQEKELADPRSFPRYYVEHIKLMLKFLLMKFGFYKRERQEKSL